MKLSDSFDNYYFKVSSYIESDNKFIGIWINKPILIVGDLSIYLYNYSIRDLLDERIFYLELQPFVPMKSSSTNDCYDKMFGVLFPSTQSKEWLYLNCSAKEIFQPTDTKNLDKLHIILYDSEGRNLNNIYLKKLGLLNTNYYKCIYTTLIINVNESSKSLDNK